METCGLATSFLYESYDKKRPDTDYSEGGPGHSFVDWDEKFRKANEEMEYGYDVAWPPTARLMPDF